MRANGARRTEHRFAPPNYSVAPRMSPISVIDTAWECHRQHTTKGSPRTGPRRAPQWRTDVLRSKGSRAHSASDSKPTCSCSSQQWQLGCPHMTQPRQPHEHKEKKGPATPQSTRLWTAKVHAEPQPHGSSGRHRQQLSQQSACDPTHRTLVHTDTFAHHVCSCTTLF